nr:hypothetical protein GCM10020093_023190 [Planobispora longispora]
MDQRRSAPEGDMLTHGRTTDTAGLTAEDRLEDEDYPAYSMGAAAEMLGVTATFLRALGAARLIEPKRSRGGHRRYSRYQLRLAARAGNSSTRVPPWKPPAGSSSWKTSWPKRCASTPNTNASARPGTDIGGLVSDRVDVVTTRRARPRAPPKARAPSEDGARTYPESVRH